MVNTKTKFPRGISDQVISLRAATAGTGVHLVRANSLKLQAPSSKSLKLQAASIKPQAASVKLKPASIKLQDPGPLKKFQAPLIKGLYQDK